MQPKLNRRRALFVLTKIDEIPAWEQRKEAEKDTKFVELGKYLCEIRAGQYWRLENLKSFDEFLGRRFPESRHKAYYLMSIHEHLPPQARRELKEVGWSKGLELAKLARRDRQEFDCATWLHKAREMPKEEFKQEVGAGRKSRRWSTLKKLYNRGVFYRVMLPVFFIPLNIARSLAVDLSRFRNPMKRYRAYKQYRGMSIMRDWIDWIGGWPYEFAAAEQVADFCKSRGFEMLTCNKSGWVLGNNEFVFERLGEHPASP